MYVYAGNNPVRYTDPDGNIVIPAVVIFYFAVFAATAVELYLLSPSGQQSIQVAGEALAYGVQYASQAVFNTINNTVDCIKKNVAYYNATKAKAQKVTNEQTKESNVIRFQLQTGSETLASVVRISNDKIGVKKRDAYGALAELYKSAVIEQPGLARCEDFTSAIVKMSEHVKSTQGEYKQGANVWRETFIYQDKEYRIDLENIRGINLVE